MSLIEEALKKQQEEFGNQETAQAQNAKSPPEKLAPTLKKTEPLPPHPLPPPLPDPPAKPSSKTLLPVIILVSVCVILLAVTFWLISAGFLKMFMSPKEPQSIPPTEAAQVEPSTSAQPPETPTAQPSLPSAPLQPTPVASPPTTEAPPVVVAPPPPKTLPSMPDSPAPVPPRTPPSSVSPQTSPKTPIRIVDTDDSPPTRNPPALIKRPPVWPDINITGIIDADGVNGAALINGQLINVGETVQGVTLIAISRNSIKASFEGETRTLKVGGK